MNELLFLLQDVTTFGNTNHSGVGASAMDLLSPERKVSMNKRKSQYESAATTATSIFEFTPAVIPKFSTMMTSNTDYLQFQTPISTATAAASSTVNIAGDGTAMTSTTSTTLVEESPVMNVTEMFGLAGWKTPIPLPEMERKSIVSSSSSSSSLKTVSLSFDSIQGNDWKEENKLRIDKSISDLLRSINHETTQLDIVIRDLVDITTQGTSTISTNTSMDTNLSSMQTSMTSLSTLAAGGAGGGGGMMMESQESLPQTQEAISSNNTAMNQNQSLLPEIPQSLEEIYHLASKNRKKNKNKKRTTGSMIDATGGTTTIDNKEKKDTFSYEEYIQETGKPMDTSTVDATVSHLLSYHLI